MLTQFSVHSVLILPHPLPFPFNKFSKKSDPPVYSDPLPLIKHLREYKGFWKLSKDGGYMNSESVQKGTTEANVSSLSTWDTLFLDKSPFFAAVETVRKVYHTLAWISLGEDWFNNYSSSFATEGFARKV